MDERISSAVYNPHDPYDISTAVGNQRLTEDWEDHARVYSSGRDFPRQVRLFVFQLGILAVFSALAALFA